MELTTTEFRHEQNPALLRFITIRLKDPGTTTRAHVVFYPKSTTAPRYKIFKFKVGERQGLEGKCSEGR